jgi:hypothetical protein
MLEIAERTVGLSMVAQRRPPRRHRLVQNLADHARGVLRRYIACVTDGQSVKSAGKGPTPCYGAAKKSMARSGAFSLTL